MPAWSARAGALLLPLAFLARPLVAQERGFTLEQAMSAPFPTEMVAAPAGGVVAWIYDEQGARNLWVAEPPAYAGRRLTAYTADDGQEIYTPRFTPDGHAVVYVRGGPPNGRGEIPNPALDPAGEKRQLWLVPLAGGAPKLLGEGAQPAISPKGDRVAFVRKGELWWAPLDGSAPPEQIAVTRGGAGSPAWSPDGHYLAFTSARGDHGFVGVYDIQAKQLRYLAPSVDRDGHLAWAPDSKRIAFVRIPADTRRYVFGAHRTGQPWSIWVADPATGAGHQIWRADEGAGSVFRGVSAPSDLFWGAGDRIAFPWEKTGWLHLYAVPAAGGEPTLLTPGEFEVEHVALSSDGRALVYSSNQGDIDRRHLWRVPLAGGTPERLTSGSGIEYEPAPTSDGKAVAFLRSDAHLPPRPALLPLGGGEARDLAPSAIPADFPAAAMVEPKPVLVTAADGMVLHGQLFLPRNEKPGERHPALVFFHGGSRRQMLLGWNPMYYYSNAYALDQYFASRGYVVLSVNYRSGVGYGLDFREALNYGATGASEWNDVQGAGLYLRSRPDVDPKRIGAWGGSYGGYLTALALARGSDLFAAGVDFHGVHDWNLEWDRFYDGWDETKEQAARELAWRSSPMADIDGWRSPVLLIQGDDDRNVNFSQTVQLAEDLRDRDVHVELLVFPDEVHDFLTHAHWLQAYHATIDFFHRELEAAPSVRAAASER